VIDQHAEGKLEGSEGEEVGGGQQAERARVHAELGDKAAADRAVYGSKQV
jgi:hypothetical protein